MDIPKDLRFTKTHEWIRLEGDVATVGITDFAQSQLSDLTYIELPSADDTITAQDEVGVVESVKAASDIYAPLSGVIVAVNDALTNEPEALNSDPYGAGWLYKVKMGDPSDADALLNAEQYEELVPE